MVFNATFNNISVISWRSVLLVEKTGVTDKTNDLLQVNDIFYHIILYWVHLAMSGIHTHNFGGEMLWTPVKMKDWNTCFSPDSF